MPTKKRGIIGGVKNCAAKLLKEIEWLKNLNLVVNTLVIRNKGWINEYKNTIINLPIPIPNHHVADKMLQ